jgi:hypothetical protein
MDRALVNLADAGIELSHPSRTADHQGKHSGGARVERAQVPYLACAGQTPHLTDDVVRGPAGRLVDDDHSIHVG